VISLEVLRNRRQLFYGFDCPVDFHIHTTRTRMCVHAHTRTHRCCCPWKHGAINKRTICPIGKPSRGSSVWPSQLQTAPPQFTTGLGRGNQQRTSLCNNTQKDPSQRGRALPQILCFSSLSSPPIHQPLGTKRLYVIAERWAPVGEDQDDDHLLNGVFVTEFIGWGLGGTAGQRKTTQTMG